MKAQNKKALSAVTPKALSKIIPLRNRNESMNNGTAIQQNNQPKQDAWGLACEAKRVAKIVNRSAYAIRSIGDVLEFNLCNEDCGGDTLNNNVLGGLITALTLLSNNLDDCGNELGDSLVKGGFNHE